MKRRGFIASTLAVLTGASALPAIAKLPASQADHLEVGQLKFPLTYPTQQNPDGPAYVLDDYEEGKFVQVWTETNPVSAVGRYTRIGPVMNVYWEIQHGDIHRLKTATITGLPFGRTK